MTLCDFRAHLQLFGLFLHQEPWCYDVITLSNSSRKVLGKIWKWVGEYSRLWSPSNAKAHQRTQDQDPSVNGCKCAHQPIEHGPEHTHLETLCVHIHACMSLYSSKVSCIVILLRLLWLHCLISVLCIVCKRSERTIVNLLSFGHTYQICFPRGKNWSSSQ